MSINLNFTDFNSHILMIPHFNYMRNIGSSLGQEYIKSFQKWLIFATYLCCISVWFGKSLNAHSMFAKMFMIINNPHPPLQQVYNEQLGFLFYMFDIYSTYFSFYTEPRQSSPWFWFEHIEILKQERDVAPGTSISSVTDSICTQPPVSARNSI